MSDHPVMYNLAFGDMSQDADTIDDLVISNNNDRNIVLATVANTIFDFTENYGNHYIFAKGSTPSRTRLYQIGIGAMLVDINLDFDVYGFKDGLWRSFQKNVNYTAFLVKRK